MIIYKKIKKKGDNIMATLELKEIVDNSNHYETDTKKIYSLKTDDKEYKQKDYIDTKAIEQSFLLNKKNLLLILYHIIEKTPTPSDKNNKNKKPKPNL